MADKLQVTEKWGLKLLVIVITLARVAEYRQHGRSHGLYGGVISGQVGRQPAYTVGIELDKIAHEL